MDFKNRLTKTPYLVLFIVLISIGVGTASALITITLAGDVIITGFLDMTGDKITNVADPTLAGDAATKQYVDSVVSTGTPGPIDANTLDGIDSTGFVQSPSPSTRMVSIPSGSSSIACLETNSCFIPFIILVYKGDTVTWTNDDTAAHTATSGNVKDGPDGVFDSSLIIASSTFSHTFDQSGTFEYFCMVHPWQYGEVLVI